MKALIVGCGSIGRRHIINLSKLDKIKKIYVLTKVKDEDIGKARGKVEIIRDLGDIKVDFAVVCNETYKHIDTAIYLARKGFSLFVEKPISNSLDRVNRLKEIIKTKKIKFSLGYNMRFLGAIKYIKEQIIKKSIGDLYFAKIEAGQYLPQWRKGADYRRSYSASRDRGGGVALDLSHEIDYMRYLFGDPVYWKVMKAKVSELEINSEDVFQGLYLYKNSFICSAHLDYLQREKTRKIKIVGSKGILQCDFVSQRIKMKRYNGREYVINDRSYFDLNKTYVDEIMNFINSIEKKISPCISLDDGIRVLELIEENV